MDHVRYSYILSLVANVIHTGGNTANGGANNIYTGNNGINSYGYGGGSNVVATGGNTANGAYNNIGTGGNQINSHGETNNQSCKCML